MPKRKPDEPEAGFHDTPPKKGRKVSRECELQAFFLQHVPSTLPSTRVNCSLVALPHARHSTSSTFTFPVTSIPISPSTTILDSTHMLRRR